MPPPAGQPGDQIGIHRADGHRSVDHPGPHGRPFPASQVSLVAVK